jgi:hypothetical protein
MARFFCLGEFKSIEKEEGENEGSAVRNPALARASRIHGGTCAWFERSRNPSLLCEEQYQDSLKACKSLISMLFCFQAPTILFTDSHNKGALSGASSKFLKK